MDIRPNIIVYTNSLLAGSMTFIKSHAEALEKFRAVYVGSHRVNGLSLPQDRSFTVNSGGLRGTIAETLFRLTGRAPSLMRALTPFEPRLIHAHFGTSAPAALRLSRAMKIPLVVTFHGRDATINPAEAAKSWRGRELRYFSDAVKNEAACLIAVSNHIRNCLLENGYPEELVEVHRNGIDTQFFVPDPTIPREKIVVFVGRFVEKKGAEYLISAAQQLMAKGLDFRVVLIGDGPLREELRNMAAISGAPLEFPGFVPLEDIKGWLNRAVVVAVPSVTAADGDSEGLPTVVLEAQSMQVPVVGTIHSGIPEGIQDGKTGFLVPERDTTALAQALEKFLTDPELAEGFGRNARKYIIDRFELATQVRGLEAIYSSFISRD